MMRKKFIMPGSRFIGWAVCDISSNSRLPPTVAIELPPVGGRKGHGCVGSLEVVRPLAVEELEHLGDTTSISQSLKCGWACRSIKCATTSSDRHNSLDSEHAADAIHKERITLLRIKMASPSACRWGS
jgi:hypothetical protein